MKSKTQKYNFLIVEDEAVVAEDVKIFLESLGFDSINIVHSGEEAIEKTKEQTPDLILMDIVLKGEIDGIKATNIINKKQNIPVIFLTAYNDADTVSRAKKTNNFGYILKPYSREKLYSTIEYALSKNYKYKKISLEKTFIEIIEEVELNIKYGYRFIEKIIEKLVAHRIFPFGIYLYLNEKIVQKTFSFGLPQDAGNLDNGLKIPECLSKHLNGNLYDINDICKDCIYKKYGCKNLYISKIKFDRKEYGILCLSNYGKEIEKEKYIFNTLSTLSGYYMYKAENIPRQNDRSFLDFNKESKIKKIINHNEKKAIGYIAHNDKIRAEHILRETMEIGPFSNITYDLLINIYLLKNDYHNLIRTLNNAITYSKNKKFYRILRKKVITNKLFSDLKEL